MVGLRNILVYERQIFTWTRFRYVKNAYANNKISTRPSIQYLNSFGNNLSKCTNPAISVGLNSYQRRFVSTNIGPSSEDLHKVLFVTAESPNSTEVDPSNSGTTELLSTTTNLITEKSSIIDESITYIPPPPVPVETLILNELGEPTLQSLGLGSWWPPGMIQSALELIHVNLNCPWWGCIIISTIFLRLILTPIVIKTQKNSAEMSYYMPQVIEMQEKIQEAKRSGNRLEAARISYDLQHYMKEYNIKPMQSALLPLAQAPIFISMFIGLRQLTNLPVESFKTGGILWFTDLTACDPYYLLPLLTSTTLFLTIKIGAEGRMMPTSANSQMIQQGFQYGLPVIMFPFIMNFPSAVLCYWVSTNAFSMAQVSVMKIPVIRDRLEIKEVKKESAKSKNEDKGFINRIKETYNEQKLAAAVENRRQADAIRFQKAGKGPLVKTFKYNPIQMKKSIDVNAKS